MTLDASGYVRSFYAVPRHNLRPAGAPLDIEAAWRTLFEQAGLDTGSLSEAQPQYIPPVAFDIQRAWAGTSSGKRVRAEAALWRGVPVYLDVAAVPVEGEPVPQPPMTSGSRAARIIIILIFVSSVVVAPLLARYHVAMHRADTRGAARIATVVFAGELAAWVLGTSHVPTFRETYLMTVGLGRALYSAALTAVMYLALEPFVRRHWPRSLISWTRVLSGRVYDPLVGTHILIGVAIAIGVSALARVGMALNGGRHFSNTIGEPSVLVLLGGRYMAAQFPFYVSDLLLKCMTVLFLVFLFKVLLRNTGLTVTAATLLMTAAFAGTGTGDPVLRAAVVLTGTALMMTGLTRFGFLSFAVASLATTVLTEIPITYRISAWYSTASFTALAVVIALAVFGFFAATVSTRRTARTPLAVG